MSGLGILIEPAIALLIVGWGLWELRSLRRHRRAAEASREVEVTKPLRSPTGER